MAKKISPDELYRRSNIERPFRCDVCQVRAPESLMKVQDGAHVCPNCAYPMSASERDLLHANEVARATERSARHAMPLQYPGSSLMDGQVVLESFTTYPMQVTRSTEVTTYTTQFQINGIGLSADDVLSVPAGFTLSAYTPADDGLSATFDLSAAVSVAIGYHALTFNGNRYRDAVLVTA